MEQTEAFRKDAKLISSYTREQALNDGVLVDVSRMAYETGFLFSVALTQSVWAMIETIPHQLQGAADVNGRLWDVLSMAVAAARNSTPGKQSFQYQVILPHALSPRSSILTRMATLKAVCGPGDDGSPVITIMLPEED